MKKHILLVEDDTNAHRIFLNAMKRLPADFKCTCARTPHQAIDMLKHLVPDYIFVDYNLPRLNGLQFLSIVKSEAKLERSQKFLYSNGISEEVCKMAKVLGASGCIEKTDTASILAVELKSVLLPDIHPYSRSA